jgi:hypothetical protein
MKEAERMLKQMDLEISMNTKDKVNNTKLFNNYKKRLEDFRCTYFKCKEDYIYTKKMREMVVMTETERSNQSESQLLQKQSIFANEQMVERTNDSLQRAKHTVLEIENSSKEVMKDLERQTGDLKNIGNKVGEMNVSLNASNALISRMMSRENRNKALIGIFSVTLVTLFVLILYTKV